MMATNSPIQATGAPISTAAAGASTGSVTVAIDSSAWAASIAATGISTPRHSDMPGSAARQAGCRWMSWRAMIMRCISLVPSPISSSGASR